MVAVRKSGSGHVLPCLPFANVVHVSRRYSVPRSDIALALGRSPNGSHVVVGQLGAVVPLSVSRLVHSSRRC
jgi:hypothetical protein